VALSLIAAMLRQRQRFQIIHSRLFRV